MMAGLTGRRRSIIVEVSIAETGEVVVGTTAACWTSETIGRRQELASCTSIVASLAQVERGIEKHGWWARAETS